MENTAPPSAADTEQADETAASATSEATDGEQQAPPQSEADTVDYWKRRARKNEERAKANASAAKELEQLKEASATEAEKAVKQAREEGAAEVRQAYTARLVDAEIRGHAAGRDLDVDALLDTLDRARFVTDDGEVDVDGIGQWLDRIAPAERKPAGQWVDIAQGPRPVAGPEPAPGYDRLRSAFSG